MTRRRFTEDAIEDAPSLTTGLDDKDDAAPAPPAAPIKKGKPFPETKSECTLKRFVAESEHEVDASVLGLKPIKHKNRRYDYPAQLSFGGRSWTALEDGAEQWSDGKTLDGMKYRDQYGNILNVKNNSVIQPVQEDVGADDLCIYCNLNPQDPQWQPYCCGICAISAQNDD